MSGQEGHGTEQAGEDFTDPTSPNVAVDAQNKIENNGLQSDALQRNSGASQNSKDGFNANGGSGNDTLIPTKKDTRSRDSESTQRIDNKTGTEGMCLKLENPVVSKHIQDTGLTPVKQKHGVQSIPSTISDTEGGKGVNLNRDSNGGSNTPASTELATNNTDVDKPVKQETKHSEDEKCSEILQTQNKALGKDKDSLEQKTKEMENQIQKLLLENNINVEVINEKQRMLKTFRDTMNKQNGVLEACAKQDNNMQNNQTSGEEEESVKNFEQSKSHVSVEVQANLQAEELEAEKKRSEILQTQNKALGKDKDSLEQKTKEMENQIQKLLSENDINAEAINEKQGMLKTFRDTMNTQKGVLEAYAEKDIKTQTELRELRKELDKRDATIKGLQEKVDKKKTKLKDLSSQHEKKIRSKDHDIEKLKEKEQNNNRKIRDLEKTKKTELERYGKEIKYLKAAKNDLDTSLNNLHAQFNEVLKRSEEYGKAKDQLEREKQDLLLRLSKIAGANLTYNNPNIADLSDENRPTKLAEAFSELYDNQWTDAFEVVEYETDEQKTNYLLKLLQNVNQLCVDSAKEHTQLVKQSLSSLTLRVPSVTTSHINVNDTENTVSKTTDVSAKSTKSKSGDVKKDTDTEEGFVNIDMSDMSNEYKNGEQQTHEVGLDQEVNGSEINIDSKESHQNTEKPSDDSPVTTIEKSATNSENEDGGQITNTVKDKSKGKKAEGTADGQGTTNLKEDTSDVDATFDTEKMDADEKVVNAEDGSDNQQAVDTGEECKSNKEETNDREKINVKEEGKTKNDLENGGLDKGSKSPEGETKVVSEEGRNHGDSDITKAKDVVTMAVKAVGTDEQSMQADKAIGTDEQKKVLESNFDMLKNDLKKTISDVKRYFEKELTPQFQEACVKIVVAEHLIDKEQHKLVVDYIEKCVEICWSMQKHEPAVYVDFQQLDGEVPFNTDKHKPYTKSGKHVDFIVWPALFLHEGGPLLSKGVAQGKP